jgi:hypothetical protein
MRSEAFPRLKGHSCRPASLHANRGRYRYTTEDDNADALMPDAQGILWGAGTTSPSIDYLAGHLERFTIFGHNGQEGLPGDTLVNRIVVALDVCANTVAGARSIQGRGGSRMKYGNGHSVAEISA